MSRTYSFIAKDVAEDLRGFCKLFGGRLARSVTVIGPPLDFCGNSEEKRFILGDFFPVGHRQPVFFDQPLIGEEALTVSAGVRDESATDVGAQCDWDATKNDGLGVGLGDGGTFASHAAEVP